MRVGIIGLGYVGLPLATAFAEAGIDMLGTDVMEDKVAAVMLRGQFAPGQTGSVPANVDVL